MSKSKEDLQYSIIKKFLKALAIVPRELLVCLAVPLGRIWYILDRYHRDIAFDNMLKAFSNEIDKDRICHMVKANFVQLVRVALEIPSLLKLSKDNIDSYVIFSGQSHLEEALLRGKGVLFLSAHLGNWELATLATALKFDLPINALVRPLDFSPMDKVLTEIRSRTGNKVLDKDKSANLIRQILSKNQVIGIMLDQNASWYEGVYVPFFNRITCTNKGLAMFAMRYGATVLPVFNIRQKDGRYKIMFEPPVSLVRSGNISRDIVKNTTLFNTIIEKYVRMAPDNWFWVHRRWRIKDIPEKAKRKEEKRKKENSIL